jgi:hypothetical protein
VRRKYIIPYDKINLYNVLYIYTGYGKKMSIRREIKIDSTMSKEYKAYRFFAMIYVVIISNFALIIAEGIYYYVWFFGYLFCLLMREIDY